MPRRGWMLLALTAAVWGASYMFIKVALDDGLSEGVIIFVRTALGAAVLVPMAVRAGALGAAMRRGRWTVALALTQVILPFALITWGENEVPTAVAGILVAATPIFVALIAVRFDQQERSRGWGLVGIFVGMAGIVLLFGADLGDAGGKLAGGLMLLGAALCYALAVLVVKRGFTGIAPVGVAASTMVVSSVAYLPLALATAPTAVPDGDTLLALLALGAGGTGLAFAFFYRLIADYGPARASLIAYIAPAFALIYGAIILGEQITAGAVAGLVLVLGGSALAARGPRDGTPPEPPEPPVSRSGPSRSSAPAPAPAR